MQPCCTAARRAVSRRLLSTSALTQASAAASSSASTSATSYSRPVAAGKLPVYDEALAFIEQDKKEKFKTLEELNKQLNDLGQDASQRRRKDLLREITATEIASTINDPETRWHFRNGSGDMSKPVYRYLAEQAWREEGELGILMQRVSQMSVVPDIIGELQPTANIRIAVEQGFVEPGSYLKPKQTIQQPTLPVQVYHPEERLYTLLMLDPDSPDAEADSFKIKCHWAIADISLSATSTIIDGSTGRTLLSYVPPHPEQGTPYHRYTYLLCKQKDALPEVSITEDHQSSFDVRTFVQEHQLVPMGITFFRQVWDEDVTGIFKDVLNKPEPKYGRPRRVDRYQRIES